MMNRNRPIELSGFYIVGINYKKTNAEVRGYFAINKDQNERIFQMARQSHIQEFFILSTCNRTEIYGFAENPMQLVDLVCSQTSGSTEEFLELAYVKNDFEAVTHLFHVAAGLDSQILGDYEVVGQIRQAVKMAKQNGFIHSFLDRLINQVLQSSKQIKNQTALSDGTVSVAFAAVQYLKEKIINAAGLKIMLLGTGKIGKTTCKNLKEYLKPESITLINRTDEKAASLAAELDLEFAPYELLEKSINSSDIILVASNADEPVLLRTHLENKGKKLILDLSIPSNVQKEVNSLSEVSVITVDELSRMKDETLQKREAEIPKAQKIIDTHLAEFREWVDMRKHARLFRAIKSKLQEIHSTSLVQLDSENTVAASDQKIQRVINGMAPRIRYGNQPGCNYIEAINEYMATGIN
jgi:glutamyl-tRNA reductase